MSGLQKNLIFLFLFTAFIWIGEKNLYRVFFLQAEDNPFWELSYTPEELVTVRSILSQPLHFLDDGSQCWAFYTEHQDYVVKICKKTRYAKAEKKEIDFLSYLLAFEFIREQSQIVFLHLTPSNLGISLKIFDPIGIPHFIKADNLAFYVQKKTSSLCSSRCRFSPLSSMSLSEKKEFIDLLMDLFVTTSKFPIEVKDVRLKNIGLKDGSISWIDPGRIRKKQFPLSLDEQKKELIRLVSSIKPDLHLVDAELVNLLEQELNHHIVNILSNSGMED
jgi:hypothetical protein